MTRQGDFVSGGPNHFPGPEAAFRVGLSLASTVTSCLPGTTVRTAVHLYSSRLPPGCPSMHDTAGNETGTVLLATSANDPLFQYCGAITFVVDLRTMATDPALLAVVVEGRRASDFYGEVEPTPGPADVPSLAPSPRPTFLPSLCRRPRPCPCPRRPRRPSPRRGPHLRRRPPPRRHPR